MSGLIICIESENQTDRWKIRSKLIMVLKLYLIAHFL